MKPIEILVLNASPKKEESSAYQFINLLKYTYQNIKFNIFHVFGQQNYDNIFEKIKNTDAIIITFPIYAGLFPTSLLRFFNFLIEKNIKLNSTPMWSISSSLGVNDDIVADFIKDITNKINSFYIGNTSLFSNDFLIKSKRDFIAKKFHQILDLISGDFKTIVEEAKKKEIIYIVYDSNIDISKYDFSFGKKIPISNKNINAECIGCLKCCFEEECILNQKDDFKNILELLEKNATGIIFILDTENKIFSEAFKIFVDRMLSLNFYPYLKNKNIMFLTTTNTSKLHYIKEFFQNFAICLGANYIDSNISLFLYDTYKKTLSLPTYKINSTFLFFKYRFIKLAGLIFQKTFLYFINPKNEPYKPNICKIENRLLIGIFTYLCKIPIIKKLAVKQLKKRSIGRFDKIKKKLFNAIPLRDKF